MVDIEQAGEARWAGEGFSAAEEHLEVVEMGEECLGHLVGMPQYCQPSVFQLVKGADAWDSWDTRGGLAENWGNILDGINNKRYFFLG